MNKDKDFIKSVFDLITSSNKLPPTSVFILYRLLGFLLTKEKPFIYSNKKLALNTGHSLCSVERAMKKFSELHLISLTGKSCNRRIYKGQYIDFIIKKLSISSTQPSSLMDNNSTQPSDSVLCSTILQVNNSTQPSNCGELPSNCGELPSVCGIRKEENKKTTTTSASPPSVVVVISKEIDKAILKANDLKPVISEWVHSNEDLLRMCKISIDKPRFTKEGRLLSEDEKVRGVIRCISDGKLDTPSEWINKCKSKIASSFIEYQEYKSQAENDKKIDRVSGQNILKDLVILTFHQWNDQRKNPN